MLYLMFRIQAGVSRGVSYPKDCQSILFWSLPVSPKHPHMMPMKTSKTRKIKYLRFPFLHVQGKDILYTQYALGSQTRIQLHTYSTQRSRETTTFVKNSKNLITKMSPGLFDGALLVGHSCSLTSSRQWPQRSQRAPRNQPYCYHVRTKLCGETCFKDVTGTQ